MRIFPVTTKQRITCLILYFGMIAGIAFAATPPTDAEKKKEAPAKDAPQGETSSKDLPLIPANATPLPNHIKIPSIRLANATDEYNFKSNRYTLVAVFGTWNARTAEVAMRINDQIPALKSRGMGAVGVFSHDTVESLTQWTVKNKPHFPVGLSTNRFIDELRNPKVPTLWIVDDRGFIMHRSELPSHTDLNVIFAKLQLWTEF